MPFSTDGIQFFGIAPPKISSTNSMPLPRSMGSNFTRQTPNWPCPPDCFLCLPSASGFPRMVSRQVDVVALLQLRDHYFHMLLTVPCQQKLFRLRVTRETQRRVLFH